MSVTPQDVSAKLAVAITALDELRKTAPADRVRIYAALLAHTRSSCAEAFAEMERMR